MTVEAEITATAPEAQVRERRHRARHTASVLLIVLVSVLLPLVVTAGWAATTVTDTNRFVSTMSAISSNPTVTNYLAAEAASTIVVELHVEHRIEQRLPSGVGTFLAPLITSSVQQQLTRLLSSVLASQQFQHVFTASIRQLHGAFVTAMTTNESKVSQGAKLALDISPQILAAIHTLDKRGITYLNFAKPYLQGNKHLLVTLAQGREFRQVQVYFHLVTMLRWVLWVATLVLAAAAVVIDTRRRRSGFWLGIGAACSGAVGLALLSIGKRYVTSHSPTPSNVADVIFSTLTSWLRWEFRAIILIGLIAAAVLWFTGDSKHARGLRGLFAREGGKATHAVEGAMGEHATERVEAEGTTVVDWFGRYATVLAWLGVVVGGIVLATVADSLLSAAVTILLVVAWFASMVAIRRRVAAGGQATPTAS